MVRSHNIFYPLLFICRLYFKIERFPVAYLDINTVFFLLSTSHLQSYRHEMGQPDHSKRYQQLVLAISNQKQRWSRSASFAANVSSRQSLRSHQDSHFCHWPCHHTRQVILCGGQFLFKGSKQYNGPTIIIIIIIFEIEVRIYSMFCVENNVLTVNQLQNQYFPEFVVLFVN